MGTRFNDLLALTDRVDPEKVTNRTLGRVLISLRPPSFLHHSESYRGTGHSESFSHEDRQTWGGFGHRDKEVHTEYHEHTDWSRHDDGYVP